MVTVIFYEKPGCKGNARQKALLTAAGHAVEARDLKAEHWTREKLLSFLVTLPVSLWFNPSAPAIKAGQILPEQLSPNDALDLLVGDPLLVRRPLMQVGDEHRVGFDAAGIDAWIGLNGLPLPAGDLESCQHGPEGHGSCGSHAHEEGEHAAGGGH